MSTPETYDFMLYAHGEGQAIKIGHGTLAQGKMLVEALEARFADLEDRLAVTGDELDQALDLLPEDDPLRHYEGCEIIAVSERKRTEYHYVDGWDRVE